MWRLGVTRISHGADERALLQRGAFLDPDRVEGDIEREYALSVVHDDRVAVDRINICFTNQARVYRAHTRAGCPRARVRTGLRRKHSQLFSRISHPGSLFPFGACSPNR